MKLKIPLATTMNRSLQHNHTQYSGIYIACLFDSISRKRFEAILNLHFTREYQNGHGYRISGQGSNKNGETSIEDGFVTYDGNAAWWRERTVTGDIQLQILSKGSFNFQKRAFSGVRLSNAGMFESYISFGASTANDTPTVPVVSVATSSESNNDTPLENAENDVEICNGHALLLSPTRYCDAP